jgi:hypothetical protein
VFRFKIAVLLAAIFVLSANAQTAPPGSHSLELPPWLAPLPSARDEQIHTGADQIDSSYRVPQSPNEVAAHYRQQMKKAEIRFNESFDGIGAVIRCSEGKASCVIQIRERDDSTAVKISYSPNAAASESAFLLPAAPSNPPATSNPPAPAVPPPASPKAADDGPSLRQIEYEVTGTVHFANVTRKNANGGSEQQQVKLPYNDKFYAPPGSFLYLSAQKARVIKSEDGMMTARTTVVDDGIEGTVHVVIRVGGTLFQEAEATAPYGIATASGEVAK